MSDPTQLQPADGIGDSDAVRDPHAGSSLKTFNATRLTWRTWAELRVRPWLAVGLLMLMVVVGLSAFYVVQSAKERRLIRDGRPVTALVKGLGLEGRQTQASRDEVQRVHLLYTSPTDGKELTVSGWLPRKEDATVRQGDYLKIKVDPADPTIWTERTVATPLLSELTVPLVFVPIALFCLAMAAWQRQRYKRAIRTTATAHSATVVWVKQPALAPLSKQVGVTRDDGSRNVGQLYWPNRLGPPTVGGQIRVSGEKDYLVAADAYLESPVNS